jgi:hypothetical protein
VLLKIQVFCLSADVFEVSGNSMPRDTASYPRRFVITQDAFRMEQRQATFREPLLFSVPRVPLCCLRMRG